MKPIWYVVGVLLVIVSATTGLWRHSVVKNAPESVKRACAREPINLDPKQYSNCIIRHM